MLALLAPFLGSALGLGTMGTAGIGALLGAASAGMSGAKGQDLINAALLGGIGGGLGSSMLGQAGQAAGAAGQAGAAATAASPEVVGATSQLPLTTAASQGFGTMDPTMAKTLGLDLTAGTPTQLAEAATPAAAPTTAMGRLSQQVDGLSNPDFWKNVGMMRPAGMMYAMGGINDIGVAAKERKRQEELQKAFRPRYAVDNPYGSARRLYADGGDVEAPYEVSRGVRQGQIDRAVAQAEGRPTRAPQKPAAGSASGSSIPDAQGADFFRPRGAPKESQQDAAKRLRSARPQSYAAGGIAQIPNTTMTGRALYAQGGEVEDYKPELPLAQAFGGLLMPQTWNAMGANGMLPMMGMLGMAGQKYYDRHAKQDRDPNVFAQGGYLAGKSDGQADQVPAMIDGAQPAALSHGEFVVPADVVAMLGNGNSDAGSETLQAMLARVRQASTGRKKQINKVDPKKVLPA